MHGKKAEQGTLQGLWMAEDYLVQNGGAENFVVTTGCVTKRKHPHAQYGTYLAEKWKMDLRMMETEAAKKEKLKVSRSRE